MIGAGGHAKVVVATLQAAGYTVKAIFDDDPAKAEGSLLGVPIVGPVDKLRSSAGMPAIIAVGDNKARRSIAQRFEPNWITAVHPSAIVHPSVRLGLGTVVFAGSVLQPGAVLGTHVIVNTGVVLDHDCIIGDYVHLAPGTCLAGAVQVAEGALLGVGTAVVPGIQIGAWVTVGAGSVVIDDLPDNVFAVGVPARVVREHA